MKHTYIIEITSTLNARNAYLIAEKVNMLNERFHDRREAQDFCDTLNNTTAFKFYHETAKIVREI